MLIRRNLPNTGTRRLLSEALHDATPPETIISVKTPPNLAHPCLESLQSDYLVCHPHPLRRDGQVKVSITALLPTMAICPIYRPRLQLPPAIRKIFLMLRFLPSLGQITNVILVRTTLSTHRTITSPSLLGHLRLDSKTHRTRMVGFRAIQEGCLSLPPHLLRYHRCIRLLIPRTILSYPPFLRPLLLLLTSNLPLRRLPPLCLGMPLLTRQFRQR